MITAVSVPKEITSETLPPKGVAHALALCVCFGPSIVARRASRYEVDPPGGHSRPHALPVRFALAGSGDGHGRLSDRSPRAAGVNFLVGFEVAQHDEVPTWNEGDFFGRSSVRVTLVMVQPRGDLVD